MFLTRISINNPVFATMMMVAILVVGLFSYQRLGVDQFPDVDIPTVVVTASYPGASPEAVESDVTRRIEDALNTISGLDTLTSRSVEGRSVVIAQFTLDTAAAVAVQDVREKVAGIRGQLRDEVDDPTVTRFDPDSAPIVSVAVESPSRSLRELTTLADEIVLKRIQTIRGVGSATIVGGVKRQVEVQLKPDRMQALAIGVDQVVATIRSENQDLPAGNVTRGREDRVVQIEGSVKEPREIGSFIVAQRGGSPVRLTEVADVIDGQEEKTNLALFNGKPALAVDVVKVQGANTIEVADGVFRSVGELKGSLPSDIELSIVRDSSKGIRSSVHNVRSTMLEGAGLTIAIVFLFLHSWRSTVITGLTLPISVIGTFAALAFMGFTLNTMTLMALSLAIGILIDDAIVVRENIARHLEMGAGHFEAALKGTQEIGLAVMATTLAIVAVFAPVAFMGGIIGKFFYQFGITVSVAVLISLFVSFTLDPMLSSLWHDPSIGRKPRGIIRWIALLSDGLTAGILAVYRPLMRFSLRRRWVVMAAAIGIFVGSFSLVPMIGVEFVPTADMGEMTVKVTAPVGSSLEYTETKARQAEAAIKEFPEVDFTYTAINSGQAAGKNEASIAITLKPIHERVRSATELVDLMRGRLGAIPGIDLAVSLPGVGDGKPVQVSIQGANLDELARISKETAAIIAKVPGVVDMESSLKAARPTIAVSLDRELASDLGVSLQQVSDTLRPLLSGEDASSFRAPNGENYDVNVRLPETGRESREDLSRLYLASKLANEDGTPRMVALREVAKLEPGVGPSQINRRDLAREVQITANVSGRAAGDVTQDISLALKDVKLPAGYQFVSGGSAKNIEETSGYAGSALLLAVVFIYIILASQFGSFLQPLAIMASLPLSLVGVFLGLLAWGSTLNMMSAIGFIMLMGLVVKNAILLVDFVNQARKAGMGRSEAIMQAAEVRLRPILMTTLAMIFGMIPMALGLGEGGSQRAGMAHAVIGGLISSTILTLVVVPVALTLLEDMARKLGFGSKDRSEGDTVPMLQAAE
jgi:HAE1 family hydrophobic/amphiphilic exporter-1